MAKRVPQPPSPDDPGLEGNASQAVAEALPADPAAPVTPDAPRRRRTAATGSAARRAPRARTRSSPRKHAKEGHGLWEWVEASGLELVGVGRLRFLLRRFGLKGVLILALIAGYPVGQYSLISYAVNRSLPALAGDFGVAFEAEEWSFHPLALKAIARNVKIRPQHEEAGQPLFTAAEVVFQGTLLSSLRGVMDLVLLRPFHTFNEITVKHARVHLERSRTGTLNWSDYEEAMPEERRRELAAGLYRIHALKLENVSVAYIEHLPGDSGGGVIQTVQAAVFVDGINGSITDIGPARSRDQLPTRVRVAARSSDGTIDIDGRMALRGGNRPNAEGDPRLQTVALRTVPDEGLAYEITIDLNNIGAAAFARSLPPTRVMAAGGSVRGRLKLRNRAPMCESALAMENVRFTPNAQMVPSKAEYDSLYQDLRNRVESMEFKGCAPLERTVVPENKGAPTRSNPPTAVAIAASFYEQANADAPPKVRAAVARDSQTLTGRAASAVLDDMARQFSKDLGRRVGGETGQVLEAAINDGATRSTQPSGNPLTRGFRRLFGGGKKPAPPKGGR
jgi:hypothetical protein